MAAHPNRSRAVDNPARNPTPSEIRAAREAAGLTQAQAARIVCASEKSWCKWESEAALDRARMHPGLWKLFRLLTR
jgi:DNA (cytosine-5)-methyltransferase 1